MKPIHPYQLDKKMNGKTTPQTDDHLAPENREPATEGEMHDMIAVCFDAAREGEADMQFTAGLFCREGQGVPQSDASAFEWFMKSAEQGNLDACREVAECYINGRGVVRSIPDAITWMEKVTLTSDDPMDSLNLGYFYLLGERLGGLADEIANVNGFTDSFLDLSSGVIAPEQLERALPWLEKGALKSSDPRHCVVVAAVHAFGNRFANAIKVFASDGAKAALNGTADSAGAFFGEFDDPQIAIGLGSRANPRERVMVFMCGLALFDALASGEPSPESAFNHSFANRFCDYVVTRGSNIGQLPFQVETVEKWLRLSSSKGDTKWNAAADWLAKFSSASSADAESKLFKAMETDIEDEPFWNLNFDAVPEPSVAQENDAKFDGLTTAVIDRLNSETRKGDELTEQLLSYMYFSRTRADEPMSESEIARYLPNAKDERDAFFKMKRWAYRQKDPETHRHYDSALLTYRLSQIADRGIFEDWLRDQLDQLTDRGRTAFEILRQRLREHESALEQTASDTESTTDFKSLEITLAQECSKSSFLVGIVLGDEPPRPLLGAAVLNQLESPSETVRLFHRLVRPEIEQLEAIVAENPKRATKGLRYIPTTPVISAVLLALMDESSTPEAARRIAYAHEQSDITAAYLAARQAGQSLESKGHLLRSVLEAIDKWKAKGSPGHSVSSGKGLFGNGLPDYLGKVYEVLWRRAKEDLDVVKDQEQARAREGEHRQMISFLSHTLTSATAGGSNTVRKIASKLASAQANVDLPDVAQRLAAQVSRMARVESLVEVFKLYTSDDKALREGWDRDTGGEFSVLQVCAMAVQQALLRFYFSSEHESDFARLMPEADYTTVAREFMTDALALDMSTPDQARKFFAWAERRLPFLRMSFVGTESAHLAQGGARDIVIFALTGEFLGNALKYAATGQAITLDISVTPPGLEIVCRNAMKVAAVAPIHGGKTGLTFIRRVCTLINAEFDEPVVKDNVFNLRALLPIQ